MQAKMCSRCGKNVAVVFITKLEGGVQKNEGLCLKCARELHIKPVAIPYRNRASPPTIVNKSKKSISSPLKFTYFTIFLHYQSHCRWGL